MSTWYNWDKNIADPRLCISPKRWGILVAHGYQHGTGRRGFTVCDTPSICISQAGRHVYERVACGTQSTICTCCIQVFHGQGPDQVDDTWLRLHQVVASSGGRDVWFTSVLFRRALVIMAWAVEFVPWVTISAEILLLCWETPSNNPGQWTPYPSHRLVEKLPHHPLQELPAPHSPVPLHCSDLCIPVVYLSPLVYSFLFLPCT